MRFRAEQHLRRQRDIKAVRESGRRCETRGFTLWYRHRPDPIADVGGEARRLRSSALPTVSPIEKRVCVIASTAAVGGAVQRARAKRRLREVFRSRQGAIPPGYDLLLIARRALNALEYRELEQNFIDACSRIPPSPP
jgi:ribonuclease P protein component